MSASDTIQTITERGHYSVTGPVSLPLLVKNAMSLFQHDGFNFSEKRYGVLYQRDKNKPFKNPLVRISSNCQWAFYYGSTYCDCRWQLEEAKRRIDREEQGLIIFAHDHHGKGVGIVDHWKIYAEGQRRDLELVVDAYEALGFKEDYRDYQDIIDILAHYGIRRMNLMTNNPRRQKFFEERGIRTTIERLEQPIHAHLKQEYRSKKLKLGHLLTVPEAELGV